MTVIFIAGLVLLICTGAVGAFFILPFLYRKHHERLLEALCRAERSIVLTYDDGPGVQTTPELLKLFQERGVRATFFQIGRNIDLNPELAQQLLSEGHQVGSHTQNHHNAWKTNPIVSCRDMIQGRRKVDAIGGQGALFRPPFGKMTLAGLAIGWLQRMRYGWWTVDTRDALARRKVDDIVAELEQKGGGVVLMHDFDQPDPGQDQESHRDYILRLTRRLIDFSEEKNLRLTTLGDLGEVNRMSRHI